MSEALTDRLVRTARNELGQALAALCAEVGAAESSILLPASETELAFFASTNPVLLRADAPRVPISASFSGIAYFTGQTIAVADAASQAPHYKAVDEMVASRTREFAAIPCAARTVVGVLTLVNRPASDGEERRPFNIAELRRAEALAGETARAIALLPGLVGIAPPPGDSAPAVAAELLADLARLNEAEHRVVQAVVGALLRNRDE
jgi:hypothetical protein